MTTTPAPTVGERLDKLLNRTQSRLLARALDEGWDIGVSTRRRLWEGPQPRMTITGSKRCPDPQVPGHDRQITWTLSWRGDTITLDTEIEDTRLHASQERVTLDGGARGRRGRMMTALQAVETILDAVKETAPHG